MSIDRITRAVRAGIETDTAFGAVVPPLVHSSTFTFEALGKKRTYDYSRSGNPTRDLLSGALADLEGGCGAVVTSSGMSAVALVLSQLAPGSRVVAPHDAYGGTWRLLDAYARREQLHVTFADLTQPGTRAEALATRPDLVWVETPSNPLLRLTDIAAVRAEAPETQLVVDNTFLSPLLQQPLSLGADVVVHSTTKYLNGHSDVVGGAVIARDPALQESLGWWANAQGLTGSPQDAWLTLRGLRTLGVRMEQHQRNAAAVVGVLLEDPAVSRVYWPGCSHHEGHHVATQQQNGFGAMVSFELHGGRAAAAQLVEQLRCASLAESLGGVETLVCHPASMTHAAMTEDARRVAGIGEGLLRLSVGIEATTDLVSDLRGALASVV
ncbi:MAG: cystathionine gamma-synthase [Myxococcales bacterium]|nr:cystathionine gamma-synthase [Myxococcales bacterium]